MKLYKKSRGSMAIFLAVTFGTIAGISVVMASCARENALKSQNISKISLSSRAVLSEYERGLKNDYGLFALDLTSEEIRDELIFFLDENNINQNKIAVSTGPMVLGNTNVFEEEIVQYSMFLLGKNIITNNKVLVERDDSRILKNTKVIGELPSKGLKNTGISIGNLGENTTDVDSFFDRTKRKVLVNEYIMRSFNNHVEDSGETFFKNEVEYILAGKYNDKENATAVKRKLKVIRNIANLAYIKTSAKMQATILAAAAATGLAAEIAVPVITETWALAESENDLKILLNGGKVPIVKNGETWATDIDSLGNVTDKGFIDTNSETGMDYGDYLQALLYLQNNETKLKRTMDLMQINIQGKYNKNFLICNGATGFAYSVEIGKEVYEGVEKY